MTSSIPSTEENSSRSRVSFLARLIPVMSYIIPAIGAALTTFLIIRAMQAVSVAGSSGLSAVAGGISEASLPVLIALYIAIICGVAGIIFAAVRLKMPTKTVSPPPWFILISGVLCLVPVALLWEAESVLIEAIIAPSSRGIAQAAYTIRLLLIMTPIAASISVLLSLTGAVWPVSSRSRPKWGPVVALVIIELALVFAAFAFQDRISWLHQVAVAGTL